MDRGGLFWLSVVIFLFIWLGMMAIYTVITDNQKEMFCISQHLTYGGDNYCSNNHQAYPIVRCDTNPFGYCFMKEHKEKQQ